MERSVLRKEVAPSVLLFGGLIGATLAGDALLHQFGLVWVGRYLGIPGTLLIVFSFLYSLRKRKLITVGRPKTLLTLHETLAWLGALLVLVHAGIHVYAILPWLALVAMLVNVASGMTGKYLLDRARRHLAAKQSLYDPELVGEALERRLFWDSVAVDAMKQWHTIHLPITLAFAVLALIHIVSILLFWQ